MWRYYSSTIPLTSTATLHKYIVCVSLCKRQLKSSRNPVPYLMYELKLLLHYAVFFLPAVMLERLAVNILYFSSATLRIIFYKIAGSMWLALYVKLLLPLVRNKFYSCRRQLRHFENDNPACLEFVGNNMFPWILPLESSTIAGHRYDKIVPHLPVPCENNCIDYFLIGSIEKTCLRSFY